MLRPTPTPSDQSDRHADDADFRKGAVEGPPGDPGNANAQGPLDESGVPIDVDRVTEDVAGANADQTQG
jgi:hypothetical protein